MNAQSNELKDLTILVTRSPGQASRLSEKLAACGATTIEVPVIEFSEPDSFLELDTTLSTILAFDWIIFASSNAVSAVCARASELHIDITRCRIKVAAIGSATRDALLEHGINTDFQPTEYVAEQFLLEFISKYDIKGKRILWPRTAAGRTLIADRLRTIGAEVAMPEAYASILPKNSSETSRQLAELFLAKKINLITIGSSQTARNFAQLLRTGLQERLGTPDQDIDALMNKHMQDVLIATIGPKTSSTTRELFGRIDVQAQEYTIEGLVESIKLFVANTTKR